MNAKKVISLAAIVFALVSAPTVFAQTDDQNQELLQQETANLQEAANNNNNNTVNTENAEQINQTLDQANPTSAMALPPIIPAGSSYSEFVNWLKGFVAGVSYMHGGQM